MQRPKLSVNFAGSQRPEGDERSEWITGKPEESFLASLLSTGLSVEVLATNNLEGRPDGQLLG